MCLCACLRCLFLHDFFSFLDGTDMSLCIGQSSSGNGVGSGSVKSGAVFQNSLNFFLESKSTYLLSALRMYLQKNLTLYFRLCVTMSLINFIESPWSVELIMTICTTASLSQKIMTRLFTNKCDQKTAATVSAYNSRYALLGW